MLDRLHRIRATEFPDFRAPGKMFTGEVLRIKNISVGDDMCAAVVVGKKYYKTNVARNKFRRQVYAALENNIKVLDNKGGILLISPLKKVEEISWEQIKLDVDQFISK